VVAIVPRSQPRLTDFLFGRDETQKNATFFGDEEVARYTLEQIRNGIISIKDYGAVGDGATDNTTAIQNAIDAASDNGGGTVLIPGGTFNLTQIFMKSKVSLVGVGWSSVLNQPAFDNGADVGDGAVIKLDSINEQKVRLADFQILGNQAGQTQPNEGIYFENTNGTTEESVPSHTLERLWIRGTNGTGVTFRSGSRESVLYRIIVLNAQEDGFDIQSADSLMLGCTAGNPQKYGFRCRAQDSRYVGCKAYGSKTTFSGFFITGDLQTLTSCHAQDNNTHGFLLFNVTDISLSACLADSNNVSGYKLDGASQSTIHGVCATRSGGAFTHDQALQVVNTSDDNLINITSRGDDAEFSGSQRNNDIRINGHRIAVATADLLAAGAANDGLLVIEDGGTGDGNLVFYMDGERFFIDGGANA